MLNVYVRGKIMSVLIFKVDYKTQSHYRPGQALRVPGS
jgi:hypothetical protein